MKDITNEQAIKLIRRHWKTITELFDTHGLLDMTSDKDLVAFASYLNAVRELDKQLETKK